MEPLVKTLLTEPGAPKRKTSTVNNTVEVFVIWPSPLQKTMKNNLKVGLMMAAITALLVVSGNALGGSAGMALALLFSLIMNVGTYWFSDKIVLRMTRAVPLSELDAPGLFEMVRRLSDRAGIPAPRLYLVPDPSPNAFATGRSPSHGVVAVNQGLLDILDRHEVEGVVAHEIAHIKHRDTLTSAIVATMAGAISSIANIAMFSSIFGGGDDEGGNPLTLLLTMLVAPMAAMLIQFGVSRSREFEADKTAAQLTGSPRGLQRALLKLDQGVAEVPTAMSPSSAHLCIVNPFSGVGRGVVTLFSTHPPIEERVRRLEAYATAA